MANITPLLCASASGNIPCIKVLLEKGANATITLKGGVTAMHICAEAGEI